VRKLVFILFFISTAALSQQSDSTVVSSSWGEIIKNKKGTIVCNWYDSKPFIFEENGQIKGFEYDLMNSFIRYLEKKHAVEITIKWVKLNAFHEVYDRIRKLETPVFGITAISFTEARDKVVQFTPSYLPDISVVVSSRKIPRANSKEEFNLIFKDLNAYTLHESTLEKMLIDLREGNQLNFTINYTDRIGELVDHVLKDESSFAYVDLPTYLLALEQNKPVRRQYFNAVKLKGYSFIYPKGTDWDEPVSDYFNSEAFKYNANNILIDHLGPDVLSLINSLSGADNIGSDEENMILSKEQEFQYKEMIELMMKSEERKMMRNLLFGGVLIMFLLVILFYSRYNLKSKANERLAKQQEVIEKRNKRLIDLNNEKSNLMNIVSHDVRNPINQMAGLASLIKMEGDYLTEEHKELITKIIETSDRINTMVSKILNVEELEASHRELKVETIDLIKIVEGVVASFQERSKNKRIEIKTIFQDNKHNIVGDVTHVIQIIENLVSNALKFSNPDSEVTLELNNLEKYVELKVIDQGQGLSKEELPKLFKKFQKLSAQPTSGETSTGLGLSIVKKYVEAMDGEVSCTSELGKGTTFTLMLVKA